MRVCVRVCVCVRVWERERAVLLHFTSLPMRPHAASLPAAFDLKGKRQDKKKKNVYVSQNVWGYKQVSIKILPL